jgi:nitrogen regulatory protein PII
MFKMAIVLGEEELKNLVFDLVEAVKEEFGGGEGLTVEQLEEFLAISFEELLEEYDVDEVVVHLQEKWYEVGDGRSFVNLVKDFYKGLDGFLSDMNEKEVSGS